MNRRLPLLLLISLLAPLQALAGTSQGKIEMVMAHVQDIVIFKIAGEHQAKPSCSSDQWALSLSTHSGRAMYALLLSAQTQGREVFVSGTGACAAWADREEPLYVGM